MGNANSTNQTLKLKYETGFYHGEVHFRDDEKNNNNSKGRRGSRDEKKVGFCFLWQDNL